MAVKRDIKSDLTLEIAGKNVTPDKFLRSVRSFFAIVTEVTAKVAGKRTAVQWNVAVREGSNLVGLDPLPGYNATIVGKIMDAVSSGVSQIEDRAAQPPFFTERAIKSLRDLADVVGTTAEDDTKVRVWVKREPVAVSHKAVAHVAQLLASEHEDYGSVEGRLQTVTERGGFHFVIYQLLWDDSVRCYVPDHLSQKALGSFGQRVEVYGRIKYRKDGRAQSIEADDIVPFPPKEIIPSFRDVRGILRKAS
ncbi:hypothetical protein [Pseudorhodoplanes sp.]|uniref:hypothetical protein n=1 Tax=Pseudorhodoplanes sp. TaxID=1934341 RepID=UPI003D13588F